MKSEQFKHNLKKAKRLNEERRFRETIKRIDASIEVIKKLSKFI